MNKEITKLLKKITDAENIRVDEDMSKHTTFRAGGCADIFVAPENIKEAADVVRLLLSNNVPYTVIGNGSNLLVSDSGYRGCIVCMGRGTDHIIVDNNHITAGAGALLSKVAAAAYERSLTGLEFASGIPGSTGGAVVMNAGAYGNEMKDVIDSVKVLDAETGRETVLSSEEMGFGYRTSVAKNHPYVILEAYMDLTDGDRDRIKERMDELAAARRQKQPLEYPSAGSTFKRPEGFFAGKLIEDTGLKGYSIGDAMVSDKHCGFIINRGNACAADIIELIKHVRSQVYDKFNVMLEPEIVILGDDILS